MDENERQKLTFRSEAALERAYAKLDARAAKALDTWKYWRSETFRRAYGTRAYYSAEAAERRAWSRSVDAGNDLAHFERHARVIPAARKAVV